MKRALPPLVATAAMILWVACDSPGPTAPLDLQPSYSISDAAHGGMPHFYWLPPMVPQPSFDGTFLATLSPAVDICRLKVYYTDDDPPQEYYNCDGPSVRRFGPGEEVEVDPNGQHYQVNWDTNELNPATEEPYTPPGLYRITVVVDGMPLDHADVEILEHGGGFKNLTEDEALGDAVALTDGRTLPIKFRIEKELFDLFDIAFYSLLPPPPGQQFAGDIFLLSRMTGWRINITNSPGTADFGPSWSPDGQQIVFSSNRSSPGGMDLYIMDADGSNPHLLVEDGWNPAWAPGIFPDGQERIAFQRGATPGVWDPEEQTQNIWTIHPDGTGLAQITDWICSENGVEDPFEDLGPTWRPMPLGPPRLSFSRNAIYPENDISDPINWPPPCATPNFDAVTHLPFHITYFDVVQYQGNPAYVPWGGWAWDWTADNGSDDLGPVWSRSGQKVLFWKRTGDNPTGPDDGDLHILFVDPLNREPMQLTDRRGWISGASDWAPDDSEILISWGPDIFGMGLYTMVPPVVHGGPYGAPVLLAPNAIGGKYRPAH